MVINKKYLILKKDIHCLNDYFYCSVFNKVTCNYITLCHSCYYYCNKKEAIDTVFNLFVKLLKDDFITFSDREEFIKDNNITFYF